jgi:hypothetical protein
MAYAFKIMIQSKNYTNIEACDFMDLIENYLRSCEDRYKFPGLLNRWPGGFGGLTSHDEVIGASFLDSDFAKRAVNYLASQDGNYNNTGEPETIPGQHNLYRFVWFLPFVKARAGFKVNVISQFAWVTRLLGDLFNYKPGDEGGKLLTWIMLEDMSKQSICKIFIYFWKKKMKKLGLGPKKMFEIYLKECPVFHDLAPEEF